MTVREHSTLGDEEGGQEFTSADEEVLVLFAAQAATALANARTRTSGAPGPTLEALIETSPVGVAIYRRVRLFFVEGFFAYS